MTEHERRLQYWIEMTEVDWKLRATAGGLCGLAFGANGVMLGLFLSTIVAALVREFYLKRALSDLQRLPPVVPKTGPAVPDSEIRDQAQPVQPLRPESSFAPEARLDVVVDSRAPALPEPLGDDEDAEEDDADTDVRPEILGDSDDEDDERLAS